jgi:hypothetical protein
MVGLALSKNYDVIKEIKCSTIHQCIKSYLKLFNADRRRKRKTAVYINQFEHAISIFCNLTETSALVSKEEMKTVDIINDRTETCFEQLNIIKDLHTSRSFRSKGAVSLLQIPQKNIRFSQLYPKNEERYVSRTLHPRTKLQSEFKSFNIYGILADEDEPPEETPPPPKRKQKAKESNPKKRKRNPPPRKSRTSKKNPKRRRKALRKLQRNKRTQIWKRCVE